MIVVTRLASKRAEAQVEAYALKFAALDDLNLEVFGLYPERAGASVRVSRAALSTKHALFILRKFFAVHSITISVWSHPLLLQ